MNNMKLEIGKLYKIKFKRLLNEGSTFKYSSSCIRTDSVFLLLDLILRKNKPLKLNKFKVLTENGIIGWIVTGMNAESLFTAIS